MGLVTAKEAAWIIGIHPSTLCKWRRIGVGPEPKHVYEGRLILFDPDEVVDWVLKNPGPYVRGETREYHCHKATHPSRGDGPT